MDSIERYINAFVKIEKRLKEIVNIDRYIGFKSMLNIAYNKNIVVKTNYNKLIDYSDLRNLLIHQRDENGNSLAIPTLDVVMEIERIAEIISSNKKAIDFASKDLKIAKLDDNLNYIFKIMDDLDTTKIPVYADNKYVSLITAKGISKALLNNKNVAFVKDVIEYENKNENIVFMDVDSSIDDVIKLFDISKKSKANIIIISKNGKKDEIPLGIITVFDLPKIISYLL